jgi:hypothetical protein
MCCGQVIENRYENKYFFAFLKSMRKGVRDPDPDPDPYPHPLVKDTDPEIRIAPKCYGSPSIADPGCLSRIPDPDFYPSRIPDPKAATKERGEKKFVVITFYVAINFTKLQIILVLKC